LLHRDLKPDNVIVSPPSGEGDHETAKVVDFGLAKLRDVAGAGLTETGAVMGTLYYMSPEQCSGEELDARSDVYSLGAMLYEMLTGAPPFQANSLAALIAKHLHEPPPPFPVALQIPAALATACLRALAKDRNARQHDASAFSKEIQYVTASESPSRASSTAPTLLVPEQRVGPPPAQSTGVLKWLMGGVAGLIVLIVVVVGAGLALKFGASKIFQTNYNRGNSNRTVEQGATQNTNQSQEQTATASPSESKDENAIVQGSGNDLRGTWTGTYGHLGEPARLIIKNNKDGKFDGVLEQGQIQVAFNGTFESTSRKVTMKQTSVIKGPDDSWMLGTDSGKLSTDGKEMSGTGEDRLSGQLGLPYEWSFKRSTPKL
jgi:serine/threonine protein kinase